MRFVIAAALAIVLAGPSSASADTVSVEAVLSPTDTIRMDFKDGSKHFVVMVRREGTAEGQGAFAGAKVIEYGWHDIQPPVGGDPHGYLEVTAPNGDIAYLKWTVRAVFLKGGEKPKLADYGFWELVSGTGAFAEMHGVGTLQIKAVTKTDRKYILTGEVGPKP